LDLEFRRHDFFSRVRRELHRGILREQVNVFINFKYLYDKGRAIFKFPLISAPIGSPIQKLGEGIIFILGKLSRNTIFRCRLVCKTWYRCIVHRYQINQFDPPFLRNLEIPPKYGKSPIFEIGEIISCKIFQNLSPKYLAQCCLVCKSWHFEIWAAFYSFQLPRPQTKKRLWELHQQHLLLKNLFDLPKDLFMLIISKVEVVPFLNSIY